MSNLGDVLSKHMCLKRITDRGQGAPPPPATGGYGF